MNLQSVDDDILQVRKLRNGNILAFNALYRKYNNRLYRFALGYLKSREEAEEIVQEVFLTVWKNKNKLKEELSFKAFLFTISFNLIRKHFRTKAYLADYLSNSMKSDMELPISDETVFNTLNKTISDLIDLLPERRKAIFIKSRMEGMKIVDIAKELNISHKTVENQITEALKFIRTHLNKEDIALMLFTYLFLF